MSDKKTKIEKAKAVFEFLKIQFETTNVDGGNNLFIDSIEDILSFTSYLEEENIKLREGILDFPKEIIVECKENSGLGCMDYLKDQGVEVTEYKLKKVKEENDQKTN